MQSNILKMAVLISGGGSNLQSIIDACENGEISSQIALVISNKNDVFGLERARKHNIETKVINSDEELLKALSNIDLVVLAGYLKIISADILEKFRGRIINIHPSLLPKYGGHGMYGLNVHKAVLENRESFSGATVHFVTEEVDGGEIIIQKAIDITHCKTPKEIQETVIKIEHEIYKKAICIVEKGILNEKSVN